MPWKRIRNLQMEDEYVTAKAEITREDTLILLIAVSIDDQSNKDIKICNENPCIFGSAS